MLCAGTLGVRSLAPQVQPVLQRCRAGCRVLVPFPSCSGVAAWGAGGSSTRAWPARHGGASAAAPSSQDAFAGSRTPQMQEPPWLSLPRAHGSAGCAPGRTLC